MNSIFSINRLKMVGLIPIFTLLTACMGASYDNAVPTTKSRAKLQSDIQLLQPVTGAGYSRLYAYGDYLFATVKDKGLQVINNSIPENPEAVKFISIAGTKDVVIYGDTLVTNQYADLVIFSISQEKEVARINDLYDYKDYLDIPSNARWKASNILQDHVVVGFNIEEDDYNDFCFFCF